MYDKFRMLITCKHMNIRKMVYKINKSRQIHFKTYYEVTFYLQVHNIYIKKYIFGNKCIKYQLSSIHTSSLVINSKLFIIICLEVAEFLLDHDISV